jgi:acetoin utilization deacetylase AcuC-like enzyme
VAVALADLLENNENLKIAIFDLDVHDGDGTAEIISRLKPEHKGRVLFLTTHMHEDAIEGVNTPFYPYTSRTSSEDNICKFPYGPRWAVEQPQTDVAVAPQASALSSGKAAFQKEVEQMCGKATEFDPDLVIISMGFDTGKNDIGCGCNVSACLGAVAVGLAGL